RSRFDKINDIMSARWCTTRLSHPVGLHNLMHRTIIHIKNDNSLSQEMSSLLRPIMLIALIMAIPIVPFLFLGQSMEDAVNTWLSETLSPPKMLSNLGLAAAYSALGSWVYMPVAITASIALPLLATVVARKRLVAVDNGEYSS
ncbi:MAG: hypothetical protein JXM70_09840, partial [Pirellulales bacterium]|nr:hypothetical protein [Pirellulales bacterium]